MSSLASLSEKNEAIRKLLKEIGTDLSKYDDDPTGDGDQSPIVTHDNRDLARHLFSSGGAGVIEEHIPQRALSRFAFGCVVGSRKGASEMIEEAKKCARQPYSRSEGMLALLNSRETSMRLSPLLLIVSAGKGIFPAIGSQESLDFQGTARLLLRYGASPVAKDALGKTVCHYGAGAMATKMTLEVSDMCIRAAKSHHMYGKEVQLRGLQTADMNGRIGVAGGFDADSGRRSVYLENDQREVWIKTENMKLVGEADAECCASPLLSDIQDRMGTVSLHELCMPQQITGGAERPDVAEFLLKKHHTSIHTKDMDGIDPLQMTSGSAQRIGATGVAKLVMEAATREARQATKAKRQEKLRCANCGVDLEKSAPLCSKCNVARYCGRECQVKHWRGGHKDECHDLSALASGVRLDGPEKYELGGGVRYFSSSFQTGTSQQGLKYRRPSGVKYDEKFVVKVQATPGVCNNMLVYDQSKTCNFFISSDKAGFQEILKAVRAEKAWQGQKTFMKVSFDSSGVCTMYPETAGVKSHYTW